MTEHIHTLKYEYFVMYYGIEGIVVGKFTQIVPVARAG